MPNYNKSNRQKHEYSLRQKKLNVYKEQKNDLVLSLKTKEVNLLNFLIENNSDIDNYVNSNNKGEKLKIKNLDNSLFQRQKNYVNYKNFINTRNSTNNYLRYLDRKISALS